MTTLRIATFNIENFDETAPGEEPSLDVRLALMKPQIARLRADIVCFQEVNGQERPGQPRDLHALRRLLDGTNLAAAELASTRTAAGAVFDERNLVVAALHSIVKSDPEVSRSRRDATPGKVGAHADQGHAAGCCGGSPWACFATPS